MMLKRRMAGIIEDLLTVSLEKKKDTRVLEEKQREL